MAIIFIDGFDFWEEELTKYNYKSQGYYGSITTNANYARYTGGKGIQVAGDNFGSTYMHIGNLPSSDNAMIVSAAVKVSPHPLGVWPPSQNTANVCVYNDEGTFIAGVLYKNMSLQIMDYAGTVYNTGYVLQEDEWFFLEFKVIAHLTDGYLIARVNEQQVYSRGPVQTVGAGASTTLDQFRIRSIQEAVSANRGATTYYDDLWLMNTLGTKNTNFIGDCQVWTIYPNSGGTYTMWDVTGTTYNYEAVDEENAYNTTDYVYTSGTGDIDTYNYEDLPIYTTTVYGLQLNLVCQKEAGGGVGLAPMCRTTATDTSGTVGYINGSWANIFTIWDQDPYDDDDWTETKVNDAEFGVAVT